MLQAEIQVPETLNQTLPDPGDPTYQTEQLALILSNTLKELDTEGFTFKAAVPGDFTSYGNDVKGFIDAMSQREDEILLNGFSTVIATLPDVVPIIEAILSGGYSAIPSILLNGVMSQLFRSRDSSIEAKEGEVLNADIDLSEVVAALEGIQNTHDVIEGHVESLLRSFHIPANGGDAVYFLDEFRKFALDDDFLESKLSEILTEFTVNLISQWGTQGLHWGPVPEVP